MQKPQEAEITAAVERFDTNLMYMLAEDTRERVKNQVFRLLNDLPEHEWESRPDISIDVLCVMFGDHIIKYITMAKKITFVLTTIGMEIPEGFGLLPSEAYPDENVYEVMDRAAANTDDPTFGNDSPAPSHLATRAQGMLDELDFSKGFSA